MKRALIGTLLISFIGMGTALAQDGWRDRQDIRQDEVQINHDRWELRRDLREGNYAAAAHERAEIRARAHDLNRDRADLYWDRR